MQSPSTSKLDSSRRIAAVEAWGRTPGKTYTFLVDSAITYNGHAGRTIGDLNAGDFIAVQYYGGDEELAEIPAVMVRATGHGRKKGDDITTLSPVRRARPAGHSPIRLSDADPHVFSLLGKRLPARGAHGVVIAKAARGGLVSRLMQPGGYRR